MSLTLRHVRSKLPSVNAKQALVEAATAAKLGMFRVSSHLGRDRAYRNIRRGDLASAMISATSATAETETRWVLTGGVDLDGDGLTVVVAFSAGVIVVTAFATE